MRRLTFFKNHPSSLKNNLRSQYNHGNYLQKKIFMDKIGLFSRLMENTFRDNFFKRNAFYVIRPFWSVMLQATWVISAAQLQVGEYNS